MSGRIRLAFVALCACVLLGAVEAPVFGAQYARLSMSVNGPRGRTVPSTTPLKTALLVVTSSWRDIRATTDVRQSEAAGQAVGLADLAVVLSTQVLDCSTVFKPAPPPAETDVTVIAGTAYAYLLSRGWQTTSIGQIFTVLRPPTGRLTLDSFSVEVQAAALKKKKASRDWAGGAENWFVLDREGGTWRVDLAASAGDARVVVKSPLTECPVESRVTSDGAPLLTKRRLLDAAWKF
jgi:hypothetical protein